MSIDSFNLLDPPMPSYSFTLYHRDVFEKSNFKDYDSMLSNRLARGHTRASYLASIYENKRMGAHLNRRGPAMGSTTTYDAEETTYCRYNVPYESGIRTIGLMASEVIVFTLDYKLQRIMFGCGKNQKSGKVQFSGSYSGIVGLGRRVNANLSGGYSLPSQLNATVFSLCLPSFELGKSSILNFHKAPWPNATMAKLLPNYMHPQLHFVNLYKIFINDREVPVKPSWWHFDKNMRGGVVVDTGTTITHFPEDFYIVFRYIFRSEVGDDSPIVENPVGDFDTCYRADLDGGEVYFPVVKLYFGSKNPSSMLFLAQERVVTLIGDQYCLAFKGWDKDFTILGTNQLQAVGLTFDTSQNTLAFDLDACL
ncbi:hypothetical protein HAX54_032130 [Datura stramonium]|uniref:Peptidase A1 domain-containing protein n=1 Tax=Datura stramonium TaxID=4076 RepID=A0ABS8SCG6_DATST|nr:hypothetical protein [Datura stramonium]